MTCPRIQERTSKLLDIFQGQYDVNPRDWKVGEEGLLGFWSCIASYLAVGYPGCVEFVKMY